MIGAKKHAKHKKESSSAGKKSMDKISKIVTKVMKHTPSKKAPAAKEESGKRSQTKKSPGKRSTAKQTAGTPGMPLGCDKQKSTTNNMSMKDFKKYLDWHNQKRTQKPPAGPAPPAKRSKK